MLNRVIEYFRELLFGPEKLDNKYSIPEAPEPIKNPVISPYIPLHKVVIEPDEIAVAPVEALVQDLNQQEAEREARRKLIRVVPDPVAPEQPPEEKPAVASPNRRREALRLYRKGRTVTEISKKLGIARSTISYWIKKDDNY